MLLGVGLAVGMAVAAPAAHAMVPLKVNPATPIVDDDITVSFQVKKRLKPGWHYEASVIARTGYDCATFVYKDSKRNPGVNKRMSFRFSPYEDNLNSAPEWCQGKASVMVSKAKDGDEDGKSGIAIGIKSIRFVAKP